MQVTGASILASSVQFKIVSMRSEKPICAPSRLSDVSPNVAIDIATGQYRMLMNGEWRERKDIYIATGKQYRIHMNGGWRCLYLDAHYVSSDIYCLELYTQGIGAFKKKKNHYYYLIFSVVVSVAFNYKST